MSFEAILFIAVLVIAAKLGGELLHRIGQPTILGNVLAGIIVGPAFLAIVHPIEAIELFVSIGVFFLFFLIGLEEIDIAGLFKVMRGKIFAGSTVAFLIPFLVAGIFGLVIDMDFVQSFAIASVIAASSLGVTAKILSDLGKLKSTIGLEIFTVTAIVEFIAIIFVSVFIQIDTSSEFPDITEMVWLFAKMIIFFAIAGLISVFGLPQFFRLVKNHLRHQQAYFGIVIGVILLVAYFAEISGVHGAIGALLLGIAVSRMSKDEYHEISKNIGAIGYGIFIPIFFAGIGLHFSLAFLELEWWIIIIFIAIMTGVKFLSSYIAVRIANMQPATTVAYGVMSKGAVDLALMLSLLQAKIMDDKLFSLLVLGTLMTMIISSVELQRKLKKITHIKIGTLELGLIPIYFRRVVSDTPAIAVINIAFSKTTTDVTIKEFTENNKITDPFLVFDDQDNLVGLLSKHEIDKSNKKTRDSTIIGDVMSKKFQTALPEEYLFSVIQKMNTNPFDIIPIIDPKKNGKVIGIVTNKGIMELLTDNKNPNSVPE
ncbi:MAG TPA: cation:proton antiporter [Nitrosopumilaceae archaeon]|nr:cation:proton antiporter [Nitrosopumilaceae archaeon]